jgi:hypothetical protein
MLGAVFVLAALLLCAPATYAQSVDPSGHWVGTVNMPAMQVVVEVDFIKSSSGPFSGTMSHPSEKVIGLPLSKVDVKGASIAFAARTDQRFAGTLSPDGSTISGAYSIEDYLFAFTLTRMGAAKIYPVATSASIGKDLEGTWNGTLAVNGTLMRVVLTLANDANGGSTGTLTNLDEGSLAIPVATITQKGPSVTLGFKVVEGRYAATLNADHTELTGTWTDGVSSAPIAFKREPSGR